MINLPLNCDFTGKVVVITGAGGVLCGDMARAYPRFRMLCVSVAENSSRLVGIICSKP